MATFPERKIENLGVVLRHCEPAEAQLWIDFWSVVARETTHTLQTPEKPQTVESCRANWEETLASPTALKIGAFDVVDGRPRLVGQIGINVGDHHPWTRHVGVFGMMVRREYWGRGLGRALMDAMEGHARSVGVLKIEAQVRVENERGLRLYTANGYRIEGRRSRAVKIDGRFQDEFWIAKDLDSGT